MSSTNCSLTTSAAAHNRKRQAMLDALWTTKWPSGALVVAYGRRAYGSACRAKCAIGVQTTRQDCRGTFYLHNPDNGTLWTWTAPWYARTRKRFARWNEFKAEAIKRGATPAMLQAVAAYLREHNINTFG